MIKREELTNPKSCMSRAGDHEMTFVLLGRDAAAPAAIRAWIDERVALGKNMPSDEQILEAQHCADYMEQQRIDRIGLSTTKAEGGGIEKFVGRRDAAESEQNKAGTTSDEGKSNVLRSEADDQSPSLSNERPTPEPPQPSVQGPGDWITTAASDIALDIPVLKEMRLNRPPSRSYPVCAKQVAGIIRKYAPANSPSPSITEQVRQYVGEIQEINSVDCTNEGQREKCIRCYERERVIDRLMKILREAGVRVE